MMVSQPEIRCWPAFRTSENKNPKKVIIAVPVASAEANRLLTPQVDEFISLYIPQRFHFVGEFYENFSPVEDADVERLLHKAEMEMEVLH
jgi:Predicted phosphoribosyltransferases